MASSPNPSGEHQSRPPHRERPHWIEITVAIALVIVGAFQVGIYWRQAGIMQTQAVIMQRSLDLERPLVVIDTAKFEGPEPVTIPENFTLIAKNGGRSVAIVTDFVIIVFPDRDRSGLPETPNYIVKPVKWVVPPIFPNSSQQMSTAAHVVPPPGTIQSLPGLSVMPLPKAPLPNPLDGIKDGSVILDIYGYIKYHSGIDTLGGFGVSGFCFHYVPLKDRGSGPQFVTCQEQNYTYSHYYAE